MISRLILAALISIVAATGAAAKPHLRDVAEIDDGLLWVAIANEIRERCDDVSARMVRAMVTLRGLHTRAKALGYSDDEIEDYVTSKAEKTRMRHRGEAYLASTGVSLDQTDQVRALGRREIDRNSAIGVLLKAR